MKPDTPSRYLTRLEADIAKAGDTVDGDCLRAERAIYFARQGRAELATEVIAAVRAHPRTRKDFLTSAWLDLAEGLVAYFSDLELSARERIRRAQAFASSAGLKRVDSLCSAWLAQLDYSGLKLDSMAANLRRAFAGAAADHHASRARACLVTAQALHYARRFDLARDWYGRARHHAVQEGDELTTSAIMYNMAWLRMVGLRQSVLLGEPTGGEGPLTLAGSESMKSFDLLIGAESFKELDPMLSAQTLSLEGRSADALAIYDVHLAGLKIAGASRWRPVLLADVAWCRAHVGDGAGALTSAEAAGAAVATGIQIDEQAATHGRLAQAFQLLGETELAEKQMRLAEECWAQVLAHQRRIVDLTVDLRDH